MNQEKVWDNLAGQWYHFRHWPTKEVKNFHKKYSKKKGKILDIGCGNCRNLLPFAKNNFNCYGIDFSKNVLNQAKEYCKKHKIKVNSKKANMVELPFKNDYFNYILFIASLHHIKTEKNQLKALHESYRVLKKDGIMLLTVWNKLQLKFLFKKKNIYIPWKLRGKEYLRYYHLFDYFELKKLIKKTKFKIIKKNSLGKNLIFVLKK